MKVTGKFVNLHVQQHPTDNETIFENITAKSWEDILIVKYSGPEDKMEDLQRGLSSYADARPDKQVLLISADMELDLYGIEHGDETKDCVMGIDSGSADSLAGDESDRQVSRDN